MNPRSAFFYSCVCNYKIKIAPTGYSEVSIENGYYGRLYVSHYEHGYTRSEVCYYEFNRYEGETICQYYGYSYDTFIRYVILTKQL